jgi:hypothetical protein
MAYGETPPEGTECMECTAKEYKNIQLAVKDYNGHRYWVCESCYDVLDSYCEQEYD